MKTPNQEPADGKLGSLLRESRPAPVLPPRFQEHVWQRIEQAETRCATGARAKWIDALAGWLMQPRFVLAGVLLGSLAGTTQARQHAQERYLAAVAPVALH